MFESLFIGEVINNDDSLDLTDSLDSGGKVKIYVDSIMSGWETSHYPWARPFLGGGALTHGVLDIPEEGDRLWVFCEKSELLKNWYYIPGASLKKTNIVSTIAKFILTKLKLPILSGGLNLKSKYPNWKIRKYKNGIVTGVSSEDGKPEGFFYHPEGSFIQMDADGNIFSKGKWKHYGEFEATKEISAMTASDGTKVTLSKHQHGSGIPGPNTPPVPGM
jgi:hypothetical protein